jgi:hypothetical protein
VLCRLDHRFVADGADSPPIRVPSGTAARIARAEGRLDRDLSARVPVERQSQRDSSCSIGCESSIDRPALWEEAGRKWSGVGQTPCHPKDGEFHLEGGARPESESRRADHEDGASESRLADSPPHAPPGQQKCDSRREPEIDVDEERTFVQGGPIATRRLGCCRGGALPRDLQACAGDDCVAPQPIQALDTRDGRVEQFGDREEGVAALHPVDDRALGTRSRVRNRCGGGH